MSTHHDYKKDWERTRAQLTKLSKEAVEIAKKGEKEFLEFSRRSKLHIDSTAITMKKEKLYYLIGKEYTNLKSSAEPTPKLNNLVKELKTADRLQQSLRRKIKSPKRK